MQREARASETTRRRSFDSTEGLESRIDRFETDTRITDFDLGLDQIDLSQVSYANAFADLAISANGNDTVISFATPYFGGASITLEDIQPGDLSAADFVF